MPLSQHTDLVLSYTLSVPSGTADSEAMPLVFLLHGRGADANDLAELTPMIHPDYRYILPNAPEPWEAAPGFRFGFTWFHGWPAERGSFVKSRTLLLQFIDQVVERYPTPDGKIILSGFSQGGMMSLDAGFRTAQKLAGIVVMSGALYEQDLPPFKPLPVLLVHGSEDDMIPVLAARRARRVLEQHGIDPEYHEFPMGHYVTPESLAVVSSFISTSLR